MAQCDPNMTPQLRHVEAQPVEMDGGLGFVLRDPTGLAASSVTVSQAALFLLSKFDGCHTLEEVREAFFDHFGQAVDEGTLAKMVEGLSEARLLADEEFERFYESLVEAYRSAPTRVMRSVGDLELDGDTRAIIRDLLESSTSGEAVSGRIVGLVAPHLDYPRGRSCYAAAYSTLINRPAPQRVVILGTNHFGRSSSVVVTGKGFETPLGTTAADMEFIERLEGRCGDLRADEFDHEREHSVELQLLICQYIWGAEAFRLVPVLCPDPCGPVGMAPGDGQGVDLRDFAEALRHVVKEDPGDTMVIAGADLSHVGAQFGDDRALAEGFLSEVRRRDQEVLDRLAANDADAFVERVAAEGNPTHVCSAGCIFAAMYALPEAEVSVLRYHQAVDAPAQVGVTCAAAVFTE